MAQCKAEGRKHPTMDLYAGIFNSKLYTSSRGTARGSACDIWSRQSLKNPATKPESVREGASLSDGKPSEAGSLSHFKSKPAKLSANSGPSRKLASLSNEGRAPYDTTNVSVDVGHKSTAEKSSVESNIYIGNAGGVQMDRVYGANDLRNNAVTADNPRRGDGRKTLLHSVGCSLIEPATKSNAAFSRNFNHLAELGTGIGEKSIVVNHANNVKDDTHLQKGNFIKDKEHSKAASSERTNSGKHASNLKGPLVNCMPSNLSSQEECISIGQQADGTANQEHYMDGKIRHLYSEFQISEDMQGNCYSSKNSSHHVANAASLLCEAGVPDQGKPGVRSYVECSPSISDCRRFDKNNLPMAPATSTCDAGEILRGHSGTGNLMPCLDVENHCMNIAATRDNDAGTAPSCGKDFITMQDDKAIVMVSTQKNAHIKTDTNLALIGASHGTVATSGVKSLSSSDSLSSKGGSSQSGSPTAAEICSDIRAPSFGNILVTKGSPFSASARYVGSLSCVGNGSVMPCKSSFIDSLDSQSQHGLSLGRKSAELVASRRFTEVVPTRKSSEMMSSIHCRGHAMQDLSAYCVGGSANHRKGAGSTGSNISAGNGNLLVGSGNGNVKSVNSVSRQVDAVNRSTLTDCTLLRKAQASADPEEVKNAGNQFYKRGQFSEALMLYTRAVSLSPSNAAFRSIRAAAFNATGQLGKAVKELEDAVRLESSYASAHQQVASLYVRLGLLDQAKQHLCATKQQTDILEAQRLHTIGEHISRCIEARKHCLWHTVIKESDAAVVAGADSAPQVFGYKSEALLGLQRPEDADGVCTAAQRVESSLVKSGVIRADPFLFIVRAQVDMALGRFDGALEAAKSAAKIDPSNEIVSSTLRKAQSVCHTRTSGNELFKAGRFYEALALYAEGLESDPRNAILLCNRAACRLKLGQWEKAAEDCNDALQIQPNYTKALMRRANCWTKLERWEDALQDYELLRRKMPQDREVVRGIFDVHVAMMKLQGEDTHKMKFGGDVEEVVSDEQFQESITSPGLSMVQFVTRWSERCRQLAPFVDELCKRNPSVNFLRVDVEEHPCLAKFECVNFIPTFKIYRSGQKIKEILGPTEQSLENALNHYST